MRRWLSSRAQGRARARARAVIGDRRMRDSDGADLSPEYTDPNMFIPKNTRVMVRKVNAKAQSAALKDAPEKQAALAAAAAQAPAKPAPWSAAGDAPAEEETPLDEEENDEEARLQAMIEEQNAAWQENQKQRRQQQQMQQCGPAGGRAVFGAISSFFVCVSRMSGSLLVD